MQQTSLWPEERHNAGLFSQYYLDEVLLPSISKFGDPNYLSRDYLEEQFQLLREMILANEETAGKRSERQLEEDVIRGVLDKVLGQFFDVGVRKKQDIPDYILFPSSENRDRAKQIAANSDEYQSLNVGILDAKAWKRSSKVGVAAEANISQIFRYLINFYRRWGVLTDGFRWLLFANKQGIRQDQYIEFNLSEIVRNTDGFNAPNFKLFLFLFRREAFERSKGSRAILDEVLEQSAQNAERLQTNLKTKVYQALEIVAEEYRRYNHLVLATASELGELKESSLIFLYRILFLLYGESRLILPIKPNTQAYYVHSLESLLVDQVDREFRPLPNSVRYWNSLNELFGIIHGLERDGSRSRLAQDIGLPAYDGGLFDPNLYTKLGEWRLGDLAIKQVLDLLTKTGEKRNSKPVRVSYRDLGVQHLGNIYEGILENRLALEDGKITVHTDKGEKKASGSYYTPDHIVDYIVAETLGPLVNEAAARAKLVSTNGNSSAFEREILGMKVLDPAMGSGHFLVGAIDFLAEKLASKGEDDVKYTEVELQESRRRIAECCIYGVDLNPMAVELAKLSIWLHTLSASKPLTFLDNHIKTGNALIGARLSDLQTTPRRPRRASAHGSVQNTMEDSSLFPQNKLRQDIGLWLRAGELFSTTSDTIGLVKQKEELERLLDARRSKYRLLADLWTSVKFTDSNLLETIDLLRLLSDSIVVNAEEGPNVESEILRQATEIAKAKHFFHWEIEFPEAFFERDGSHRGDSAGFDAVIGNPPWIRQEAIVDKSFYRGKFQVFTGRVDIYALFIEQGARLVRASGRQGMIVSNKFTEVAYGKQLKELLSGPIQPEVVLNFRDIPVFEGITVYPMILILARCESETVRYSEEMKDFPLAIQFTEIPTREFDWKLPASVNFTRLDTELLGQIVKPLVGVKTGLNKAFLTHCSSPFTKSYLFGQNIGQYGLRGHVPKAIFPYERIDGRYVTVALRAMDECPRGQLSRNENGLKKRAIIRDRWESGGMSWIEYQQLNHEIEFEAEKIVFPNVAASPSFTIDRGKVVDMTCFVIPTDSRYLLALLNSKLLFNAFSRTAVQRRGGYYEWKVQYLSKLPIRRIHFCTPGAELHKLCEDLFSLAFEEGAQHVKSREDHQEVIDLVRRHCEYSLDSKGHNDRSDVVHNFLCAAADRMMNLNLQLRSISEELFAWMIHYGIPAASALKPKSYLNEFWKLKFSDVLAHLKKNRVRLTRADEDLLLERFTGSSATCLLLSNKIATTDWLINQAVYALYGLNEEEIAIVEGNG